MERKIHGLTQAQLDDLAVKQSNGEVTKVRCNQLGKLIGSYQKFNEETRQMAFVSINDTGSVEDFMKSLRFPFDFDKMKITKELADYSYGVLIFRQDYDQSTGKPHAEACLKQYHKVDFDKMSRPKAKDELSPWESLGFSWLLIHDPRVKAKKTPKKSIDTTKDDKTHKTPVERSETDYPRNENNN